MRATERRETLTRMAEGDLATVCDRFAAAIRNGDSKQITECGKNVRDHIDATVKVALLTFGEVYEGIQLGFDIGKLSDDDREEV